MNLPDPSSRQLEAAFIWGGNNVAPVFCCPVFHFALQTQVAFWRKSSLFAALLYTRPLSNILASVGVQMHSHLPVAIVERVLSAPAVNTILKLNLHKETLLDVLKSSLPAAEPLSLEILMML